MGLNSDSGLDSDLCVALIRSRLERVFVGVIVYVYEIFVSYALDGSNIHRWSKCQIAITSFGKVQIRFNFKDCMILESI